MNISKKHIKKLHISVLTLLMSVVMLFSGLSSAFALTGERRCGFTEEHVHDADCYERVLVCGEDHVHNLDCYELKLVCTKTEHVHSRDCYYVTKFGVETEQDWESTIPEDLSEDWREALLTVAYSQLGYTSFDENYILGEDGKTMLYYTRYGDWYGFPYGEWCVMFISFCLNYAGIPREAIPYESGCEALVSEIIDYGAFEYNGYAPQPGDFVFMSYDSGRTPSHVGIVTNYNAGSVDENGKAVGTVTTIEGNNLLAVRLRTRSTRDQTIFGYMNFSKMLEHWNAIRTINVDCDSAKVRILYDTPDKLEGLGSVRAVRLNETGSTYAEIMEELTGSASGDSGYSIYRIEEANKGPMQCLPDAESIDIVSGGEGMVLGSIVYEHKLYFFLKPQSDPEIEESAEPEAPVEASDDTPAETPEVSSADTPVETPEVSSADTAEVSAEAPVQAEDSNQPEANTDTD